MIRRRQKQVELFVIEGVRTPFSKAQGALESQPADELGRIVTKEILDRTLVDAGIIDEVVFGCVGQNARAANIARVIALRAGIPERVPAVTVHRNCASGMEAITQAMMRVQCDRGSLFLVGGAESMSGYPLEMSERMTRLFKGLARSRSAAGKITNLLSFRPSFLAPRIALLEGLTDPVHGINMGQTAEILARDFDITREEQDRFALESHRKAAAARERLRQETMMVVTPRVAVRDDTSVRAQQSIEALAKLRPIFAGRTGTVTAGNACPVTDGAVALLVGTEKAAEGSGRDPLGRVVDFAYSGLDPTRMGLGPVHAMNQLLDRNGLGLDDIDLFEINEAFAAQVLGVLRASMSEDYARRVLGRDHVLGEIPMEKLNVNGGAIALGHPVGASGARLVLTLMKELERRGLKRGIASLCVGGGQGAALLVEV